MIDLQTLQLTSDFVTEFRRLGKSVGYRNLGRAIAYAPVDGIPSSTPIVAPNGNGHKAHAETCHEAGWRIMREIGGDPFDLARKVHNLRLNVRGKGGGCPCGDSKTQVADVPYKAPRAAASPRSRPYKGKRYPGCGFCQENQAHRFTHDVKWPFTYSVLRRRGWNEADPSSVSLLCYDVAAAMPTRKCCGRKMGLTPDYTDAHHWRYQCDKNPDHCQDVMITIGPS